MSHEGLQQFISNIFQYNEHLKKFKEIQFLTQTVMSIVILQQMNIKGNNAYKIEKNTSGILLMVIVSVV